MNLGQHHYQIINEELTSTIVGTGGFSEAIQTQPVKLDSRVFVQRQGRLEVLRGFFAATLDIFKRAIAGQVAPVVKNLLLSDVPDMYGIAFHRDLPAEVWTPPVFFRTDESVGGQIFEIQCPGSGWGDLQLLANVYGRHHPNVVLSEFKPSAAVAEEISLLTKSVSPSVLHLLDNSSNPVSMRYLMATTQPPLRYWGYEPSVRNAHCEFVRSHSFFGLLAENLFKTRLKDASKGLVRFDLPPVIVFDQKMSQCLPFLPETREFFSDAVRQALVYSSPVMGGGFLDLDGAWVTIESFLSRPAKQRKYFLKYAGCDVSINWGSRSVYRLNDRQAPSLLRMAAREAEQGRYWLVQPEVCDKELVSHFDKNDGNEVQNTLTAKYSCFYGPTRLIGIRTMHRRHYKVHGQQDTVLGLAVSG